VSASVRAAASRAATEQVSTLDDVRAEAHPMHPIGDNLVFGWRRTFAQLEELEKAKVEAAEAQTRHRQRSAHDAL
jgi:hypothetical protein